MNNSSLGGDPSSELSMFQELLSQMQNSNGQSYTDILDDDDYDDDEDDDDDADGFYEEESIHALPNPYGEEGGDMQFPNMDQILKVIGGANMDDLGAALGIGNMANAAMDAMPSFMPNMGALAGAFAGEMGNMMDYGGHEGASIQEYDEDDSEEEDDDDDDEELSDEEDEEDDEDEEDEEEEEDENGHHLEASEIAMGGLGIMAAANLFHGSNSHHQRFPEQYNQEQHPMMHAPPPSTVSRSIPNLPSLQSSLAGSMGFVLPTVAAAATAAAAASLGRQAMSSSHHQSMPSFRHPMAPPQQPMAPHRAIAPPHLLSNKPLSIHSQPPVAKPPRQLAPSPLPNKAQPQQPPRTPSNNTPQPKARTVNQNVITTSITPYKGAMSGGTVSIVTPSEEEKEMNGGTDPFISVDSGINPSIVRNLLGNSGGTTVVNKCNASPNATVIVPSNNATNPPRSLPEHNNPMEGLASALALSKIGYNPKHIPHMTMSSPNVQAILKAQSTQSQLQALEKQKAIKECEDDKASLGSVSGSETSGMGKSDTESVGKKTPSPMPHSSNGQEVGSCASIPDLASATESMRDSDTDNHSEIHNVTANLSDLDSDVHDHKVKSMQQHYGPPPVTVEHPEFGWDSMIGLDKAKNALKMRFADASFPTVYDGTEGICRAILLFGPPDSGKTSLARALAKELNNALFVGINSRFILNHHPNQAIMLIRHLFEEARRQKPAVILFDEIEALSFNPNHETAILAKEEILAQIRGLTTMPPYYPPRPDRINNNQNIMILGTTNQPWLLEERIRRVFTYNIHVKLPEEEPRRDLFSTFLSNVQHNITEEQFKCLLSKSDGYSAKEIRDAITLASKMVEPQGRRYLCYDDIATVMTQQGCRFTLDLKQKYSAYIKAATHRADETDENSKNKKDKKKVGKLGKMAKGVGKFVLSVID